MTCKTCGKALGRRNKSGYCTAHVSAAIAQNPQWREKQAKGLRDKIKHDPAFRDACRERALRLARDPAIKEQRKAQFRALKVWEIGAAVQRENPEHRAKAARTRSATRMAWCPPHLREAYRELVYSKRYLAAEAKEIILDQDRREVERLRDRMAQMGYSACSA